MSEGDELVWGRHAVEEALRAGEGVAELLLAAGTERGGPLGKLASRARTAGVPVKHVPRAALDREVGHGRHQGVAARVASYRYRDLDELVAVALKAREPLLILALDAVQDVHNLGSLLRSAEAVGAHGVVLPERRAAGVTAAVRKASAGAVAHLGVARMPLVAALDALKGRGATVVGLSESGEVDALGGALDLTGDLVLVVGSEGQGLGGAVARRCDRLARLPMEGRVASLNAAVAGSVLLYEALRQRRARRGAEAEGAAEGARAETPESDASVRGETA